MVCAGSDTQPHACERTPCTFTIEVIHKIIVYHQKTEQRVITDWWSEIENHKYGSSPSAFSASVTPKTNVQSHIDRLPGGSSAMNLATSADVSRCERVRRGQSEHVQSDMGSVEARVRNSKLRSIP